MREVKAWGSANHIFSSPHCAVSILETEAGGYCSRHKHAHRVNRFVVTSGEIDVVEYAEDGQTETTRKRLLPGDVVDVDPGVIHRFEVVIPGMVIEVYWSGDGAAVSLDDIERLDVGGKQGEAQ